MPQITVEGDEPITIDAEPGKKLVNCLEDGGVDILHRCGGLARCTTCRIEIVSGEVSPQSDEEREALEDPEWIAKYRLSCQIRTEHDLTIRVIKRSHIEDIAPGPRPED